MHRHGTRANAISGVNQSEHRAARYQNISAFLCAFSWPIMSTDSCRQSIAIESMLRPCASVCLQRTPGLPFLASCFRPSGSASTLTLWTSYRSCFQNRPGSEKKPEHAIVYRIAPQARAKHSYRMRARGETLRSSTGLRLVRLRRRIHIDLVGLVALARSVSGEALRSPSSNYTNSEPLRMSRLSVHNGRRTHLS